MKDLKLKLPSEYSVKELEDLKEWAEDEKKEYEEFIIEIDEELTKRV